MESRSEPAKRSMASAYRLGVPVALLAAIAVVYFPSLRGEFVFDDEIAVQTNESIRSLQKIHRVLHPPARTPVAARPISNLTFAVDYAIGALHPLGYRLTNLLLHGACALLIWWIALRSLLRAEGQRQLAEGAAVVAAAIAAIWAVHPLLVEAVAYISQRSELLAAVFYLLTLACAMQGWESPTARRRYAMFTLSVAACALGMASKEIVVSAPLAVLLYDRAFVSGSFRTALARSRGLYIALAATWCVPVWLLLSNELGSAAGFGRGVTVWEYLLTQSGVIVWYVSRCFVPTGLSIAHDVPIVRSLNAVLEQSVLIVALLGGTLWALRYRPRVAFSACCFFMILAPTSSFIPLVSEPIAERRMYLPLAAVLSLVIPGIWLALRKLRFPVSAAIACFVLVAGLLAILTRASASRYGDALAVWEHALRLDPRNQTALVNRGSVLANRGRRDEALASFRAAERVNPQSVLAHYNIGIILLSQRNLAEAAQSFANAVRIQPLAWPAAQKLATTLVQLQRYPDAVEAYAHALRLQPDWADGMNDLAWIRATTAIDALRDGREAVNLATRACDLSGWQNPSHLDTLAAAYAETGDFARAIELVDRAIGVSEARRDAADAELRARRAVYERGSPYRQPAP